MAHRKLVEFSVHGDFPSFFVCLPEAKIQISINHPSIGLPTFSYGNLHFPMVFLSLAHFLDLLIRGPKKMKNIHLIDSPVMVDFLLGK